MPGLAVHGNLLVSDGWRAGFPRYLLTRVMLRERTVEAALAAGLQPPRASSRNLILGDAEGSIANVELAVHGAAVQRAADGVLTHANHFTSPQLAGTDRYIPESSCHRETRMRQLLDDAAAASDGRATAGLLPRPRRLPRLDLRASQSRWRRQDGGLVDQ